MSDQAITRGAHHIGLIVPDLATTCAFFTGVLGFGQVGGSPDYPAVFLSDGTIMITLWQAKEPARAGFFDRRNNIGLHHFALRVPDAEALDALHRKLQGIDGVEIEFAPERLGGGSIQHMMCTIPDCIRTEFIALTA